MELFSKSSRGGLEGEEPFEESAFLFCKAFFFVPFAAKKKASNVYRNRHGYPHRLQRQTV
jgi:hypothetical protein